jgi:hypothetical protein
MYLNTSKIYEIFWNGMDLVFRGLSILCGGLEKIFLESACVVKINAALLHSQSGTTV